MSKSPLLEAEQYYKSRRWPELISLLEPLSAMYKENPRFCYLLGCAYLQRSDTGGSYSYLRRAQSLDFRNPEAAMGLAAVHLKRGETDKAVQLYVDILERSPSYHKARTALDYLRRNGDSIERGLATRTGRRILYPGPHASWKPIFIGLGIVAALALAIVLGLMAIRSIQNSRPTRPGIAEIELSTDERHSPVNSSGEFELVLSESEAVAGFDRAKELFSQYRDEAALVEINRLLLSNASRQVKAKAEALALYVRPPSFLTMPDRFGWADVQPNPRLYEGVAVIWKGMPANVRVLSDESGYSFDLLVGYHDGRKLEGIVGVRVPFAVSIDPDKPIEILGRIRASQSSPVGFWLDCAAIHQ